MNEFLSKIQKNKEYREVVLDTLCVGIVESSKIRDILDYVIENKLSLFDVPEFSEPFYEDEEKLILEVLPCIKKVFIKVYVNFPPIFNLTGGLENHNKKRLELFQLLFDVDDFIDYFIKTINKNKFCLENFEYLDRTSETISLIVDNYIASLIKKVTSSSNIDIDIRDLKLKNLVK